MAEAREIFVETDLVGFEGQRDSLQIYTDWQVRFNSVEVDVNPEAAICLAAIIIRRDELLDRENRKEAVFGLHHESVSKGMEPTKIVKPLDDGDETKIDQSVQRSSEYILLRKDVPFNPYLFAIGYVGAKRILLCSNVQNMDYGLQMIHNFFETRDDANGLLHYEKDFSAQYRIRKQGQQYGKKTEESFDDAIKKLKATPEKGQVREVGSVGIVDPLRKRPVRNSSASAPIVDYDTAASLSRVRDEEEIDIVAELLSKYTPLKEYESVLTNFVTGLPDGSIVQESDLLDLASTLGHTPNPADIDKVIQKCSKKGQIKKTFIGEYNSREVVAYKRFGSR